MLDCGFDRDGVTALHGAAMFGRADPVRVLLAHGASVNPFDGMFAATPLVWACEGWNHGPQAGADHLAVARLLLVAGSPLEKGCRQKKAPDSGMQDLLIELCRAHDTRLALCAASRA